MDEDDFLDLISSPDYNLMTPRVLLNMNELKEFIVSSSYKEFTKNSSMRLTGTPTGFFLSAPKTINPFMVFGILHLYGLKINKSKRLTEDLINDKKVNVSVQIRDDRGQFIDRMDELGIVAYVSNE
jgi:hypothetical protein